MTQMLFVIAGLAVITIFEAIWSLLPIRRKGPALGALAKKLKRMEEDSSIIIENADESIKKRSPKSPITRPYLRLDRLHTRIKEQSTLLQTDSDNDPSTQVRTRSITPLPYSQTRSHKAPEMRPELRSAPTTIMPNPISSGAELTISNSEGDVVNFFLSKNVHRLGRDAEWADLLLPSHGWSIVSGRHAVFARERSDYRIYDGFYTEEANNASRNGIFIHGKPIDSKKGYLLADDDQIEIGQDPKSKITLSYRREQREKLRYRALLRSVEQPDKIWSFKALSLMRIGRKPDMNELVIDEPWISSQHAEIFGRRVVKPQQKTGEEINYFLRDNSRYGSFHKKNETWTEVHRQEIRLTSGDQLRFGSKSQGLLLEFEITE